MSYYDQENAKMNAATMAGSLEVRNRNVIPNLKAQRQELIMRIEKIDALLNIFEKNPDFVKMYDLARELI